MKLPIYEWKACGDNWCLTKDEGKEPCYRVHIQERDSIGNPAWGQAACIHFPRSGKRDYENLAARAICELVTSLLESRGGEK